MKYKTRIIVIIIIFMKRSKIYNELTYGELVIVMTVCYTSQNF
jgi:hypothetical protein